jgi:hypothetical protein
VKHFKDIKIETKCEHSPSYGIDDIYYSWDLVLGKNRVKLDGNSCYSDGYVLREKDIKDLLGDINLYTRKKLFTDNPNIFYKIKDMNHELKEQAMGISDEERAHLIDKRSQILDLIKEYENLMQRILKKKTSFSAHYREF